MKVKELFVAGCQGLSIGLMCSLIFSAVFSDVYSPVNPHSIMGVWYGQHLTNVQTMAVCVGLWFLIGCLFSLGGWFFQQEWSLLRMTICHFITMLICLFGIGFLAGWYNPNVTNVLLFSVIFSIIYAIIYWFSLQEMKRIIQEVDGQLKYSQDK
ncbi:DUF3021 domain-containing protein [Streptococcus sciuri]|uniref:DUF3021 domain-containing protein n=1 Tax=Streptococcus sciuri TaxID=2973939 RepID=A0ABT2F681_9STRE|nr:DUF3021 domain-containing protein [Streptococcus sciuri]MCS4487934.1 DUF3021 domain-containing protein [Streptococcus sciuri]